MSRVFNNLLLLADYFGVTLDYLLCRDMFVGKFNTLSQDQQQLLEYYNQCDVIDQSYLLAKAEAMAKEGNKKNVINKAKVYR